jgi:hypothetical protein
MLPSGSAPLDVHLVGDTTTYVVAASALLGVVVGGLLNGLVSSLLDRNSRRASARVASLLVCEELLASSAALIELGQEPTWMTLRRARDFGKRQAWEQHRATLGYALVPDGYMTLAVAYRGLAHAAGRAAEDPADVEPSERDGKAVAGTYLALNRGLAYLSLLLHMPSVLLPLARRKLKRDVTTQVEHLLLRDENYQEFMAKYGA